ncbi:2Fe-2S iron-sulfur cluster-binding protein [Janibacter melonis]|uniref:(2Fe-2S)-binding protein n=1 Tax=Janibacter melonis TaxID=262209 RepID=UPI00296B23C6
MTDRSTTTTVTLTVDGRSHEIEVEPRTTLLDTLRERLGVTSAKKGCDHGQCGSCTVLLDGRRHLTCLTLAVQQDGAEITTAAGLAGVDATAHGDPSLTALDDAELHPVQQAFVDRDALQCGYCTPGQVCSAVGVLDEIAQGHASHVTDDLEEGLDGGAQLTRDEIRERMSGNLCRCGAYPNIVDAICQAAGDPPPDRVAEAEIVSGAGDGGAR